jgi:hypothetical protein
MRKSVLYIVSLLAWVGACAPEDYDNVWVGPTCHDGIQNQDEEDIDCGGRCTECKVYVPVFSPCTSELKDNRLSMDDRDIQIAVRDVKCDDGNGYRIGVLIDKYNSFVLQIGTAGKPTESGTYTITSSVTYLNSYEAAIQYDEEGYDYSFKSKSGKVYVNVAKDGKVGIEFCDVVIETEDYWGYELESRVVSGRFIGCQE